MDVKELRKALDAVAHFKHLGDWPQNLSDGTKTLLSSIPLDPTLHTDDFHCLVDPETRLCVICNVDHGGECCLCLGRGYHKFPCRAVGIGKEP